MHPAWLHIQCCCKWIASKQVGAHAICSPGLRVSTFLVRHRAIETAFTALHSVNYIMSAVCFSAQRVAVPRAPRSAGLLPHLQNYAAVHRSAASSGRSGVESQSCIRQRIARSATGRRASLRPVTALAVAEPADTKIGACIAFVCDPTEEGRSSSSLAWLHIALCHWLCRTFTCTSMLPTLRIARLLSPSHLCHRDLLAGFVGLGIMGFAMATNLIKVGRTAVGCGGGLAAVRLAASRWLLQARPLNSLHAWPGCLALQAVGCRSGARHTQLSELSPGRLQCDCVESHGREERRTCRRGGERGREPC